MYLNPLDPRALPGVEDRRSGQELVAITNAQSQGHLPSSFPVDLWVTQKSRYERYWRWYRGDILNEEVGTTDSGEPIYKYPLKINPVRNFSRKHTALLFGEIPDTPAQLIKPTVRPKAIFGSASDELREEAYWLEAVLNEVWEQSNGRSLLAENGILSQFLGGCVFKVCYEPWREDTLIPITFRKVVPDFFLPIWSHDSDWDLLESHVVYRVPSVILERQYGFKSENPTALYYEYWNKDINTILVDGKPLVADYGDERITYNKAENPFGLVPYIYVPRFREGNFYGSSFIDDIEGLVLEYNARLADLGDAVRKTVHRKWIGRNITVTPKPKLFDNGEHFIDIGQAIPGSSHEPELSPVDAPVWNQGFIGVPEGLWDQINRDSNLGPVTHGEDEGSQRSGLTLAIRMWPSTSVAKQQRVSWREGLSHLHRYTLKMLSILGTKIGDNVVPEDFQKRFDLDVDWLPMIPRDREAQVRELLDRLNNGGMSIEKYVEDIGDVADYQKEIDGIKAWKKFLAETEAQAKPNQQSPNGGAPKVSTS